MEPIDAVIDGEPAQLSVAAREPDKVIMRVGDREVEMSRGQLRRLMYQLAGGHTVALQMESALIGLRDA